MKEMRITVEDKFHRQILDAVTKGGYSSISEYVRHAIRAQLEREQSEKRKTHGIED